MQKKHKMAKEQLMRDGPKKKRGGGSRGSLNGYHVGAALKSIVLHGAEIFVLITQLNAAQDGEVQGIPIPPGWLQDAISEIF